MKDLLKFLIQLQEADTHILEKRRFIDKVPMRIHKVDEPLKKVSSEIEVIKQKSEALIKKKREKEIKLDEINEKIKKMKSRVSDIKTNKEYQAHLKEIETSEKEIIDVEDQILLIMEELENSLKLQKEKQDKMNIEVKKINVFKQELAQEVEKYEKELELLKAERARLVELIEPELYNKYMTLLSLCNGIAVTLAKNEICLGCNMNVPPQLFVELRKNEEIIQCQQCHRILYYSEN